MSGLDNVPLKAMLGRKVRIINDEGDYIEGVVESIQLALSDSSGGQLGLDSITIKKMPS